jgi:hypothetical protein
MSVRDQRMLLLAALVTSVALVVATLAGHAELLAYAAPLCLVALPLLAGRYIGEDALERLRESRTPPPHPVAAAIPVGVRRPATLFPRGGRLIAQALAERGPPAPALT